MKIKERKVWNSTTFGNDCRETEKGPLPNSFDEMRVKNRNFRKHTKTLRKKITLINLSNAEFGS
jgi:hypothetical protein